MELESIEFLPNFHYFSSETYTQINESAEYSRENSCSYQSEDSFSHNSCFLDGETMEELLQMEIFEALESNPINPDSINVAEMELWTEPKHDEGRRRAEEEEEENSYFKRIQQELMEENSLTDLLLAAAEAIEEQNHLLASDLIEKLKNLLSKSESTDHMCSSFNKLAWFFTQGLQLHYKSVDIIAASMADHEQASSRKNATMSAFQMLQELSPYVKFAHFTANQAILEAAEGEQTLHIIDFDIMEGIQWPSLMADLASLKDIFSLRLTAIVHDHENEQKVQQTGRRLADFAESINFSFVFDQMVIEEEHGFERIQAGDSVIANCSGVLQSHRNISKIKTFLSGISKLCPKRIILVEEELFKLSKAEYCTSFVEFFFEAFHYFSALSDSLRRCFTGENGFGQIEKFVGKRIMDSVSQFPCENNELRDVFHGIKGYKQIPFSSFNHSQAKYLVSLFRGDFWVQNEKCSLTLCWKLRPLCSATIWVPTVKNGGLI